MILEKNDSAGAHRPYMLAAFSCALIMLCLWGTIQAGWWETAPWPIQGARPFYAVMVVSFIIYLGAARIGLPFIILLAPCVAMHTSIWGIGPFMAVLWFWVCSTLIGGAFLKLFRDGPTQSFSVHAAGIGFAINGSLIGAMSHFYICTPLVFLSIFSAAAAISGWWLKIGADIAQRMPSLFSRQRRSMLDCLLVALTLVGITVVAIGQMYPEIGHDALSMHLNILARMLEEHRWAYDVHQYIWAVMPMGGNWLLVPAYFIAGENGARLMVASFVFAIGFLAYRILLPRVGTFALAAPILLFALPLTVLVSGTVFVESAQAFFFILCLAELLGTPERPKGSWLFMGIAGGYACAVKLMAVPMIPLLLLCSIFLARQGEFQKASVRRVLGGIIAFVVVAAPPYLGAFLKTGNPLFPFFDQIFQSSVFAADRAANGAASLNPLFAKPMQLRMLWDTTFHSGQFGEFPQDGAIGITFFVLLILSLFGSLIERNRKLLVGTLVALIYVIVLFRQQAYLRYIYQVVPWVIVFGIAAMQRMLVWKWLTAVLIMIMAIIGIARFPVASFQLRSFDASLLYDRDAASNLVEKANPAIVIGDIISKSPELRSRKILLIGTDPVFSHYPSGTIADSWHSWRFYADFHAADDLREAVRKSGVEIIVHPVGVGEPNEKKILAMTDELFRAAGMRIGQIDPSTIYTRELLSGGELSSLGSAWQNNGAHQVATGVEVTSAHSIVQAVDARSFQRALLELNVTCESGKRFRSQILWIRANGKLIKPDIDVHSCESTHQIVRRFVIKPRDAEVAQVYGSGYDDQPVLMNSISLKAPAKGVNN